jgi:hypothetical protein
MTSLEVASHEVRALKEAGALKLTGESNGNHGSGAFIENVLTHYQNWTLSGLFSPLRCIGCGHNWHDRLGGRAAPDQG